MEIDTEKEDIVIIGGGLGGLTAAILLAKNGRSVLLIEKKNYPFHRVCGEYISNEVKYFLQSEQLFPSELRPTEVSRFKLTSTSGRSVDMPLDLGGFGISRYAFDDYLYKKAVALGVDFKLQEQVLDTVFLKEKNHFQLELKSGETLYASHVIGAFGKRSTMDRTLNRSFIQKRSPYIGVKYHIKGDFEPDTIAIHAYHGGYCGLNPIENNLFNLCYLGSREQLRECGSIKKMEERFLYKNLHLEKLFAQGEFVRDRPEVINEINFESKEPVENHLLMVGDAAGLIAPLFGNGMAIAIHSGKLAAEAILQNSSRKGIEGQYQENWRCFFENRLATGRLVQKLFSVPRMAELTTALLQRSPFLGRQIMKRTHGKSF
ncbi:MAG TPA: NAD(P)/FAD-dependent oxidoreductase [Cyclobacteriaceae bacterium]|nr:NAD(P)/FAD-dependent oxidoreductase [Cyclobacteriaceae bacterium]